MYACAGETTKLGCQLTIGTPPKNNLISITALNGLWDSTEDRTELEPHFVAEASARESTLATIETTSVAHSVWRITLTSRHSLTELPKLWGSILLLLLLLQPLLILRVVEYLFIFGLDGGIAS